MRGLGIRALCVCAALALAACGTTPPKRAAGDAPTFVSLNPCLDAILVEVAEPDQVLALSHYSRDPASSSMDVERAAQFGVTGGTAEEVIALRPDMVLASSFIDPATRSALERAGMRVETFGSPASVEESLTQVREIAAVVGREQAGEAIANRIAARLPNAQDPAPEPYTVHGLLWQPGEIVAGEASLVWELMAASGLASHASAIGLDQADHVTLEQLVADPPDLLLIAGDARGQEHPLLDRLTTTRVERFEPQLFYCGGPSIEAAWKRLEQIREDFNVAPPGSVIREPR